METKKCLGSKEVNKNRLAGWWIWNEDGWMDGGEGISTSVLLDGGIDDLLAGSHDAQVNHSVV